MLHEWKKILLAFMCIVRLGAVSLQVNVTIR